MGDLQVFFGVLQRKRVFSDSRVCVAQTPACATFAYPEKGNDNSEFYFLFHNTQYNTMQHSTIQYFIDFCSMGLSIITIILKVLFKKIQSYNLKHLFNGYRDR